MKRIYFRKMVEKPYQLLLKNATSVTLDITVFWQQGTGPQSNQQLEPLASDSETMFSIPNCTPQLNVAFEVEWDDADGHHAQTLCCISPHTDCADVFTLAPQ
jgi:hypothetical protein